MKIRDAEILHTLKFRIIIQSLNVNLQISIVKILHLLHLIFCFAFGVDNSRKKQKITVAYFVLPLLLNLIVVSILYQYLFLNTSTPMATKPERVLLPTNVVPKSYAIKLQPKFSDFTFEGLFYLFLFFFQFYMFNIKILIK